MGNEDRVLGLERQFLGCWPRDVQIAVAAMFDIIVRHLSAFSECPVVSRSQTIKFVSFKWERTLALVCVSHRDAVYIGVHVVLLIRNALTRLGIQNAKYNVSFIEQKGRNAFLHPTTSQFCPTPCLPIFCILKRHSYI
jgi:hypothetical protein